MVKGLALFREYFKDFTDKYILIGGAACDLLFAEAGGTFRATKDLDIVLCLETLDIEFTRAFWSFVDDGGYTCRERRSGRPEFFRFHKPTDPAYPAMLELFSRKPDMLVVPHGQNVVPIPADEDVSSLSAILLQDDYYDLVRSSANVVDGVPRAGSEVLILLKANAFLDLWKRKGGEEQIDEKKIRKHRNDVFRLYTLVDPSLRLEVPRSVYEDIHRFISTMADEEIDLKALGISMDKEDLLSHLGEIFVIRNEPTK